MLRTGPIYCRRRGHHLASLRCPAVQVVCIIDSLSPGGAETSTIELADGVRAHGVDVTIVTLQRRPSPLDLEAERRGLVVERLQSEGWRGQVRELRRLLAARRPDVVHTALFASDQVGRVAGRWARVPVVSSLVSVPYDRARVHSGVARPWKIRAVQVLDALTARLGADRLHAVSEGVKVANARALRYPLDRIVVAERGRDAEALGVGSTERRRTVRAALGLAESDEVLLSLGRIDRQKNHVGLIEAIAMLADRPNLVLLVAGKEGSASAEVDAALAARPEVARRVRLMGHRRDIGDLLSAADLLVVSSTIEGTAGVTIEAKAVGCPVVSTRLEGLRGVLTHDVDAWLCEPQSPTALAEAIRFALDHPADRQRWAAAGRADFEQRFTLEAAAQRMADLYAEVAAARRG